MKTKYELLYAQINNFPLDKRAEIQLINNKVCLNDGKKNIIIYDLGLPEQYKLDFLTFKLQCTDKMCLVIVEIDTKKYLNLIRTPYLIENRKLFFSIIKKCQCESIYSCIASTFTKQLNTGTNFGQWITESSRRQNFKMLPSNIFKIEDSFIDFEYGIIKQNNIQFTNLHFSGGIIVDKLGSKNIKTFVEHISKISKLPSLIICEQNSCELWKSVIEKGGHKYTIIISKKDHCSLKYSKIEQLDFIIISSQYLFSKSYSSSWDEYVINDRVSFQQIFDIIKTEYGDNLLLSDTVSPILSLIKWNNLIIDTSVLEKMIVSQQIEELITTIKSTTRWMYIKDTNPLKNSVMSYYRYFFSVYTINLPLYDQTEQNILTIKYNCWQINETSKTENKKIIAVPMDGLESSIISYFNKNNNYLNQKTDYVINSIINNSKSIGTIIGTIVEKQECSICTEKITPMSPLLYMKCNHYFCTNCTLMTCFTNSSCPLCREDVNIKDLYVIKETGQILGSRYKKFIEMVRLNQFEGRLGVFVDQIMVKYIATLLEEIGISSIMCCGSYSNKIKTIKHFNLEETIKIIIVRSLDYELSKNFKDVHNLIFLDSNDFFKDIVLDNNMIGYLFIGIDQNIENNI